MLNSDGGSLLAVIIAAVFVIGIIGFIALMVVLYDKKKKNGDYTPLTEDEINAGLCEKDEGADTDKQD